MTEITHSLFVRDFTDYASRAFKNISEEINNFSLLTIKGVINDSNKNYRITN